MLGSTFQRATLPLAWLALTGCAAGTADGPRTAGGSPSPAVLQGPPPGLEALRPGRHARVTRLDRRTVRGEVEGWAADTLWLLVGPRSVALPAEDFRAVAVRDRTGPMAKGAIAGSVTGFFLLWSIGRGVCDGWLNAPGCSPTKAGLVGAVGGGLFGALLGLAITGGWRQIAGGE